MCDVGHIPVLLNEVIDSLQPKDGDVIVDLTAGRGGHAAALAKHCKSSNVILFDLDANNLTFAGNRVKQESGVVPVCVHANFATAAQIMHQQARKADIVLADLGFASNQMDSPERGLSFMHEGPLDMRLDPESGKTAADIINEFSEQELAEIIFTKGEDPFSRQIARKIVLERAKEPILSTTRLANIVRDAYGSKARASRMNPATRTFMALRIAVNDELIALDALLHDVEASCRKGAEGWLQPDARVGVISFHSLEDRRVKQSFTALEKAGLVERLNRKPIQATDEEVAANPRARPAKYRAMRVLHASS
ncbi:MAG: 16S rRNA (cytosine(1402)-N(4))-methyltransferase RsmH [Planctomycetota bacterium]|nr:16S rRNA (cytosine(1402)-N(4))-methyltransferase RsmH [Planctomycetota bacterium]